MGLFRREKQKRPPIPPHPHAAQLGQLAAGLIGVFTAKRRGFHKPTNLNDIDYVAKFLNAFVDYDAVPDMLVEQIWTGWVEAAMAAGWAEESRESKLVTKQDMEAAASMVRRYTLTELALVPDDAADPAMHIYTKFGKRYDGEFSNLF